MVRVPKKHNILTSPTTSESLGMSDSANITAQSSGFEGDDSNSLFPQLKEQKEWASKTTSNISYDMGIKVEAENKK